MSSGTNNEDLPKRERPDRTARVSKRIWEIACSVRIALVFCLTGAQAIPQITPLHVFEAVEPHMGTLFRIKLYAASEQQAAAAFRAGFARIQALDQTLSDYNPNSELMQLCRRPPNQPIHLSDDLFHVLDASEKLSLASSGAFDVTEAPVIQLWRQARKSKQLPDPAALQDAATRSGFENLSIDTAHHTATLARSGMLLDLGGIAKGYAADEALIALRAQGVRSALVAASGDIAVSDAPPGERGWRIGVDSVDLPQANFTRVLNVSNAAVSTSGDTEQFVEINGQRYSHIIDPKTHQALTRRLTVTVAAATGMGADGLATALCVLGPERGLQLLKHYPGAEALFFRTDSEPSVIESPKFREFVGHPDTHIRPPQ